MRHYRLGAHTKSDLKLHVVWIPKYSKAVLTGEVAVSCARPSAANRRRTRTGDREGRTRPRAPVSVVSAQPAGESDHATAEGNQLAGAIAGVSPLAQEILGSAFLVKGILAVSSGTITDEMIREYIDEQEGEQIIDDSRFPIDNP